MTSNFNDDYLSSPTLREYMRITKARDQGLAGAEKPKPIAKTATAKEPEPKSFSEHLLLLTSKLRDQGFTTHAAELETKYLLLKKAERHLYNTHDETGEDMVDFAHPGGGNKDLDKGWGELGEIESIVERHKKILDVVRKEPSKAKVSVASVAKIILAQEKDHSYLKTMTHEQLERKLIDQKNEIARTINILIKSTAREGVNITARQQYNQLVESLGANLKDASIDSLEGLKDKIQAIQAILDGWIESDALKKIAPHYNTVIAQIDWLIEDVKHYEAQELGDQPLVPDAGASHEAAPEATKPAATSDIAAHLKTANDMLTKVKAYETKAGGDQAKTELVQKIQQSLVTYVQDLGALIQLQRTVPFAVAAEKAGSGIFKGIKDVAEFDQKAQEYFGQVNEFISDMSQWK